MRIFLAKLLVSTIFSGAVNKEHHIVSNKYEYWAIMEGYWQGNLRQRRLGHHKPEINDFELNRASHHE